MGDELLLRSRCPSGAGCYRDGAEHVYVRERTVTPPRTGLRRSVHARVNAITRTGQMKLVDDCVIVVPGPVFPILT